MSNQDAKMPQHNPTNPIPARIKIYVAVITTFPKKYEHYAKNKTPGVPPHLDSTMQHNAQNDHWHIYAG